MVREKMFSFFFVRALLLERVGVGAISPPPHPQIQNSRRLVGLELGGSKLNVYYETHLF